MRNQKGRLYDKFRSRLMFPVIDVRGDVVAFGGRVLDKSEPKYMNTTETIVYSKRRNLYGINLAKKTKRSNFILCEGNIDVITLHQAGFDNAVASMGTALTTEQTRLLSRYTKELVLCYDNDAAGQMATQKNIELLRNSEFTVRVLSLPRRLADGQYVKQDVDDFIKYQGPAAFEAALGGSVNQVDYRMEAVAAKYDLTDGVQKIAYAGEISQLIAALPNAVEREVYAGRAAERAGLTREAMLLDVKRARDRHQGRECRNSGGRCSGKPSTSAPSASPRTGPSAIPTCAPPWRRRGSSACCCWTCPWRTGAVIWRRRTSALPFWGRSTGCCWRGGPRGAACP